MNKFIYQFGICNKVIDNICSMIGRGIWPEQISYRELYDELSKLYQRFQRNLKCIRVVLKIGYCQI